MNHYDVLGVGPDATAAELRTAYRTLARRFHPDAADPTDAPDDASTRMVELNEAWSVLSDQDRRRAYDQRQWPPAPPPPMSSEPVARAVVYQQPPDVEARPASIIQAVPVLLVAAGLIVFSLGFGASMPALLAIGALLLVLGGLGAAANVLLALRGDPGARARARTQYLADKAERQAQRAKERGR